MVDQTCAGLDPHLSFSLSLAELDPNKTVQKWIVLTIVGHPSISAIFLHLIYIGPSVLSFFCSHSNEMSPGRKAVMNPNVGLALMLPIWQIVIHSNPQQTETGLRSITE